jgi:hypothetical protein
MRQARSQLKRLLRPGTEVIVIAACARELPLLSTNLASVHSARNSSTKVCILTASHPFELEGDRWGQLPRANGQRAESSARLRTPSSNSPLRLSTVLGTRAVATSVRSPLRHCCQRPLSYDSATELPTPSPPFRFDWLHCPYSWHCVRHVHSHQHPISVRTRGDCFGTGLHTPAASMRKLARSSPPPYLAGTQRLQSRASRLEPRLYRGGEPARGAADPRGPARSAATGGAARGPDRHRPEARPAQADEAGTARASRTRREGGLA